MGEIKDWRCPVKGFEVEGSGPQNGTEIQAYQANVFSRIIVTEVAFGRHFLVASTTHKFQLQTMFQANHCYWPDV